MDDNVNADDDVNTEASNLIIFERIVLFIDEDDNDDDDSWSRLYGLQPKVTILIDE